MIRLPILTGNSRDGWPGIAQQTTKLDEEVNELHYELAMGNVIDATNESFDALLCIFNIQKRLKEIDPYAYERGYLDFLEKIQRYAKERGWTIENWLELIPDKEAVS